MAGKIPIRLLNYGHRRGLCRSVATSSLRSMPPLVQQLRGPHEPPQELSRLLPSRRPCHRRESPPSLLAAPPPPPPPPPLPRPPPHHRPQRPPPPSRVAPTPRPPPRPPRAFPPPAT